MSDYSQNNPYQYNIRYKIDTEALKKEEFYLTVTLDTTTTLHKENEDYQNCEESYDDNSKSGDFYKQTVYLNGKVLYNGDYNKLQWDNFKINELNKLKYFCIGRSTAGSDGLWHYSKMNAYCLRLYSRGLTEEEVHSNYEKATKYHSILEKE